MKYEELPTSGVECVGLKQIHTDRDLDRSSSLVDFALAYYLLICIGLNTYYYLTNLITRLERSNNEDD